MGRGVDNYYLILELDFMKPESDEAVINKRIDEKVKFWNANSERDRKRGPKYRQYKSQIINIKKVMKTEGPRQAEAKEAREYVQGILDKEMRFFKGQEIDKSAAEAIMEEAGIWPEMFEKMTGRKIVESKQETKREDPNPKRESFSKFKTSETPLNTLQRQNLYDFLADGDKEAIIGIQSLDGEELLKNYSVPLKQKYINDRTDMGTAVRTLCALCEEIFADGNQAQRQEYDKYVSWKKKDDIITRMVKYSGTGKVLDEQQQTLFLDELTIIERDRKKAEESFQAICAYKGIRYMGGSSSSQEKRIACGYCFAMVDISGGQRKCSSCGRNLYMECPDCGKEVPASAAACGYCGFKMDDVRRTEQLCSMAKEAMENMDFAKAGAHLASASRLLSSYGKIAEIKKELEKREILFAKEVEQLNSLVSEKAYYEADSVLKKLREKVPAAKIANDVLIESTVAEAERLYKQAVSETSESSLIKLCSQITDVCADYPGVDALILKYPPQPVSNVRIQTDTAACSNTLTWDKSPSEGEISYKIIRKEDTAAASMDDPAAEEIGTAGLPRFVDARLKAGINYYYSIYAMRANVASQPSYASAYNLAEVSIVKKEEGDGFVRAEWKPLGKNAEVEVWRDTKKCPLKCGDGEKIAAGSNFFMDDTVDNDQKYHYLIAVNYHVDGKDVTTKGVSLTLVPAKIPEPVEDFKVSNVEDDIFQAEWTCEVNEKVMLYCTDKRCSLQYGDVVDIQKVSEILKPLDIVSSSKNSCRFRIKDDKKYVIIPVLVQNSTAIIGEQAAAAKLEKIKVKDTEWLNSELRINIEWPKDAVSVLTLYGNDGYAASMDDRRGKVARNTSKKQFDADGALILKNIEKNDYYITLYTASRVNGELMYSDGTQVLFSNKAKADIEYTIHVKGFLSKQIEVEFKSKESSFSLPDIDVISKQNGIPVYVNSGSLVEHIDARMVEGSYKITLEAKSLPKNSYLKAFFTDDSMNDSISLRPVYGTDFKVS